MAPSTSTPIPTPPFSSTLTTPRLLLHLHTADNDMQTSHILTILNAPSTLSQVNDRGLLTREDVLALATSRALSLPVRGPANPAFPCTYIVHLRDDTETMVGMVNLWQGQDVPPDMGWAVLGEFAGRGYATEAGKAALGYWTGECRIGEIVACIDEKNEASRRIARKLGFEEVGGEGEKRVWVLRGMRRLEGMEVELLCS